MIRRAKHLIPVCAVAALAVFGVCLAFPAEAAQKTRHAQPRNSVQYQAPPGDVVVRTGRNMAYTPNPSYNQNPWQSFLGGPHQRYYADTVMAPNPLVYSFGQTAVLPSRFDPPGQTDPLFRF